ncbi:MAG: hypothetical protein OXF41_07175 [bacterium]|nr:hypothetical protein [bacterium]
MEAFEEALANLEFARARELTDREEGSRKDRMRERVRAARIEATDRAEKLAARIQFLARADHYEGLLALAADPATDQLLVLLSTELRRGARLHLDGAIRRQARFRSAARRHMKAAAEALVLFDTARAAGELDKVEARWLAGKQREELAELRVQTEQADAERIDFENRTAAVLREESAEPPGASHTTRDARRQAGPRRERNPESAAAIPSAPDDSSQRPRMHRGGCLGSGVAVLLILALAVLALTH